MRITSINFFLFLLISVIVYYCFPKKYRWFALLSASLFFFVFASSLNMLIYIGAAVITTYIGARIIDEKCKSSTSKKWLLFLTLLCLLSPLFILKYFNIVPMTANIFGNLFNINIGMNTINLIAPIGISYYSLSLISYIIDVYRGTIKPQKNFFKLGLFASYYPALVSGPIMRYPEMENELYEPRKFDINNLIQGFQRLVYGLLKKLVIADQLAILVNTVFGKYSSFNEYIIFATILYAIQIYNDFSGCMDIVIGASKMYGVKLPENFDSPFFSRTLSEFWRRWHISLGAWGKDYIMYPLLKSNFFQNIGVKCRKIFGKKTGKKIPTFLAILILWLIIGLWHGASFKYIVAAGIIPWIYLTVGQLFEDFNKKITERLKINTEAFSWHLFQSLRTIALMCFIWLVACSPNLSDTIDVIRTIFTRTNLNIAKILPKIPRLMLLVSGSIVIAVDYLNYKGIDPQKKFNEQNLWFRYAMLLFMIAIILVYGAYGPGYNPTEFIYGGF